MEETNSEHLFNYWECANWIPSYRRTSHVYALCSVNASLQFYACVVYWVYWSILEYTVVLWFWGVYSNLFLILYSPNIEIMSIQGKSFGKNMIFCFVCFDYKNWITEIKLRNLIKNIFGFTLISYILMKICLIINVLCVE